AEALGAELLAPAPVSKGAAARLVRRVRGLELALQRHGDDGRAIIALADLVSLMSNRFVASTLSELEVNPLVWTGDHWEALDGVAVDTRTFAGERAQM
ncbi:MAG TPA: hypothetical protein VJ398_05865, partial [Acidimicrobiia bacterium]|nr:hypothetical protein [Acidimicrobiia bacterium]